MRLVSLLLGALVGSTVGAPAPKVNTNTALDPLAGRDDVAAEKKPAQVVVCDDLELEGKCEVIEFTKDNGCQAVNEPVQSRIKSLWQLKGAWCEYYQDDSCSGAPAFSLDSRQEYNFFDDLVEDDGNKIGFIKCTNDMPLDAVSGKVSVPRVLSSCGEFGCKLPESVKLCNDYGLRGYCQTMHFDVIKSCHALSTPPSGHVVSLMQMKGTYCDYFEHNCEAREPILFSINSMDEPVVRKMLGWALPWTINYVKCYDKDRNGVSASIAARDNTENELPESVKLCDDVGLRGYCQSMHFDVIKGCHALSHPTPAYKVKSILQMKGTYCDYFEKSCEASEPILFSLNSIPGPQIIGQLNGDTGSKIGYVKCYDAWATTDGIEAPKDGAEAPVSKVIAIRDDTTKALPVVNKLPMSAKICDRPLYTGGNCQDLHFGVDNMGSCQGLSDSLKYKVKSIIQVFGTSCDYFEHSCDDERALFSLWSYHHGVDVNTAGVGHRIGYVKCFDHWRAEASNEGKDLDLAGRISNNEFHTSDNSAEIDNALSTTGTDNPPQPGDVLICSQHHLQENCVVVHAHEQCINVPQPVNRKNKSLTQFKGVHCVYWASDNCYGESIFTLNTLESLLYLDEMLVFEWWVASVKCWVPKQLSDSITPKDEAPAAVETQSNEKFARLLHPGDILLCTGHDLQEDCVLAHAFEQCSNIEEPFTRKVKSLSQYQDAHCEYYFKDNCDGPAALKIDSADLLAYRDNLHQFDNWFASVKCTASKETIERRNEDKFDIEVASPKDFSSSEDGRVPSLPGTITYCTEHYLEGSCYTIRLWNSCAERFPFIKSIRQSPGTVCKYYRVPGCDDRDGRYRPVEFDTYSGERIIASFGSFPVRSIWCGPKVPVQDKDDEATDVLNTRDTTTDLIENNTAGTVWACTKKNFTNCAQYSALKTCENLDRSIGVKSFRQAPKSVCRWHKGWGCTTSDPTVVVSKDGLAEQADLGENADTFKSVKCLPLWYDDEIVESQDIEAAVVPSEDPGTVWACAEQNYGKCVRYLSVDRCQNLDRSSGLSSFRQAQGAICYWHNGWGCGSEDPLEVSSRQNNVEVPDLDENLGLKSVVCHI